MISVVINTLNEEENIRDCIVSTKGFADEIVVCDMRSDDRTVELARTMGARVVLHDRVGFVEPARRFAIASASYEWVLVLDAYERLTPVLADKLRDLSADESVDVVSFWSLYWYFGGWIHHGGFFNGNWRRFFRKNVYLESYKESEKSVHMNFDALRDHPRTRYLESDFHILHLAYPSIEKYCSKTLGFYGALEGRQYFEAGIQPSVVKLLWQPVREFLVRFLLRQGFRDGMRGFVLAVLYSGYRFSVWANCWFASIEKHSSGDVSDHY